MMIHMGFALTYLLTLEWFFYYFYFSVSVVLSVTFPVAVEK